MHTPATDQARPTYSPQLPHSSSFTLNTPHSISSIHSSNPTTSDQPDVADQCHQDERPVSLRETILTPASTQQNLPRSASNSSSFISDQSLHDTSPFIQGFTSETHANRGQPNEERSEVDLSARTLSREESNEDSSGSAQRGLRSDWIAVAESGPEGLGSEWLADSESETQDLGPEWLADSESEAGTIAKSKMSVSEVRSMLTRNRMVVDDAEARVLGQPLIDKAIDIMDDRRNSELSDKKAGKIVETMKFYSTKNETTMLINLWSLLVNEKRFCKMKLASGEEESLSPEEEKEAMQWIKRAWVKDDKLWTKYQAEFFAHTLPEIAKTGDEALDVLLAAVPRIAKPRPDLCIGFDGKAFSARVLEVLEQFGCKLTAEQYLSFFETEAKGADGTLGEASNQCCRGGSGMTKLCRNFFKSTNAWLSVVPSKASSSSQTASAVHSSSTTEIEYPRPDMKSFTFSMALTPDLAVMFVHWAAEMDDYTEIWHQSKLRSYKLDTVDDLRQLHCNIDNVLDWGISNRKRKMEAQCERFLEYIVKLTPAEKTTAGKRAKDTLESSIIKRQKIDS